MSINGRRVYKVDRSRDFKAKLAARSEYLAPLDRVLEGVEWSLGRDPKFRARHVVGNIWVVETPRDIEAPLLWIYYTIEGKRVLLRGYHVVRDL